MQKNNRISVHAWRPHHAQCSKTVSKEYVLFAGPYVYSPVTVYIQQVSLRVFEPVFIARIRGCIVYNCGVSDSS